MLFVAANYVAGSAGTNLSPPAGTLPGDMLLALVRVSSPAPASITFSGWTKLGYETTSGSPGWSFHQRIADGTATDTLTKPAAGWLTTSSIAAYRGAGAAPLASTGNWGNGTVSVPGANQPIPGLALPGRCVVVCGLSIAQNTSTLQALSSLSFDSTFTEDSSAFIPPSTNQYALAWAHSRTLSGTADPTVSVHGWNGSAVDWGQLVAFPGGSGSGMLL